MPTRTSNSPLPIGRERAGVRAALDGVNLVVEVVDVDAEVVEVISEFLGGALGEGGLKCAPAGQRKTALGKRASVSAALGEAFPKSSQAL